MLEKWELRQKTFSDFADGWAAKSFLIIRFLILGSVPMLGQTFSYTNFATHTGIVLNGEAAPASAIPPETATVLRLMGGATFNAGSAWYSQSVSVSQGFSTTFGFNINSCVGIACADGFAFVIQNSTAGTAAIGGVGEGIGYAGIENSLAVEFDTFQNFYDPNANHVAVQSCGAGPNTSDHGVCNLSINSTLPLTLADGANHVVTITYLPGTLTSSIDGKLVMTTSVDLSALLALNNGKAFVGLTAAAAAGGENSDILNWSFSTRLPFLNHFPLAGNPYSASVISAFDHMMTNGSTYHVYGCDNTVEAYTGEIGQKTFGSNTGNVLCKASGYAQSKPATPFYLNGKYLGAGGTPPSAFLNYDGHPGIDYWAAYGTPVLAAVAGTVHYPTYCMLTARSRAKTANCDLPQNEDLTIGGDPDQLGVLELDTSSAPGYKIFYLHLSTHPRTISLHLTVSQAGQDFIASVGSAIPVPIPTQCPGTIQTGTLSISGHIALNGVGLQGATVILLGTLLTQTTTTNASGNYQFPNLPSGYYHLEAAMQGYTFAAAHPNVMIKDGTAVTMGQPIALSGNSGHCIAPHLHFEVQKQTTSGQSRLVAYSYVPVDPYGWDGPPGTDPYPMITAGVQNQPLWNYSPFVTSIDTATATANVPFLLTISGTGFDSAVVDCLILKGTNYSNQTCIHGTVQSRSARQLVVQETLAAGTYFVRVANSNGNKSNWRALSVQ